MYNILGNILITVLVWTLLVSLRHCCGSDLASAMWNVSALAFGIFGPPCLLTLQLRAVDTTQRHSDG